MRQLAKEGLPRRPTAQHGAAGGSLAGPHAGSCSSLLLGWLQLIVRDAFVARKQAAGSRENLGLTRRQGGCFGGTPQAEKSGNGGFIATHEMGKASVQRCKLGRRQRREKTLCRGGLGERHRHTAEKDVAERDNDCSATAGVQRQGIPWQCIVHPGRTWDGSLGSLGLLSSEEGKRGGCVLVGRALRGLWGDGGGGVGLAAGRAAVEPALWRR